MSHDQHPTITPTQNYPIHGNNLFRNAFAAIACKALPFMAPDAYHSDLLMDAEMASRLATGERMYLLVRRLGTFAYGYPDDAVEHLRRTDGVAVVRIKREKYDTFKVEVIHTDDERMAHYGLT